MFTFLQDDMERGNNFKALFPKTALLLSCPPSLTPHFSSLDIGAILRSGGCLGEYYVRDLVGKIVLKKVWHSAQSVWSFLTPTTVPLHDFWRWD